jgi:hypothetical protein
MGHACQREVFGMDVTRLVAARSGITYASARVDLVSAASIRNRYFRQSVESTKALLYAA